jgi:tetratricopeptide (TPR) repeat protein
MRLEHTLIRLLQEGQLALQEGRHVAAETALAEVLKRDPGQPHALQLLGQLAQVQGNLTDAEALFERAVRAKPTLTHAWSQLGSIREDLGHLPAAEACFRRAAELKPDFVEALYNRARLLRQLADPSEAARCLAQALRCQTGSAALRAQILQLQALLLDDAGQLKPALATLDQALQAAPQRAALHHNRGVLLHRLARPTEALAAHDEALRLGLDAADAHYNRGNTLQSLGRPNDALTAYRMALAREPQHGLALFDTARLRWRLGHAAFLSELDAAAAAAPGSALAPGIKGRLMLRAGRFAEAAEAYAQAASSMDGAPGYHDGLGQALARLGRFDEAIAAHRRAVQLAPQQAAVHISHASSLLQAGDLIAAVASAELAVQLDPTDQQAWAFLGLAWRATEDSREAWLNDYTQQVQVFDLSPPPGWTDMAAFNSALAAALAPLHIDSQAPIDQTLRHGSQTEGNIFEQAHPMVIQIRLRIAAAVDDYIKHLDTLPADPAHPLMGRSAPIWRFTDSWSSRLRSGGFHTHHVHSHGWISSCYYVALPPAIARLGAQTNAQAGWITFGTPDIVVSGRPMASRHAVQPQVGRLVLFPSYMWHGTVPFEDTGTRLTLAFDVVPQSGPA